MSKRVLPETGVIVARRRHCAFLTFCLTGVFYVCCYTPSTLLSFPHRWSRRRLSSLQPTDEARKEKQRRKAGARAPKLYTILHNYYGVGGVGLAALPPRVVQKAKEAHQVVASSSLLIAKSAYGMTTLPDRRSLKEDKEQEEAV